MNTFHPAAPALQRRLRLPFPALLTLILAMLLLSTATLPAHGGPILDEILNVMQRGAHAGARDDGRSLDIPPGGSLGQTFPISGDAEKVYRIAIWQAFWHESWQPDEILVLTIWDSPARTTSYGRYSLPYARRMWESAVPMFTVDARVPRDATAYFELTVELEPLRPAEEPTEWKLSKSRPGILNGDRSIHGFGAARGDAPGTAYVSGQPQPFDLWYEIHEVRVPDRDAHYAEAFARFNLDHPGLEAVREAVGGRAWDRAAAELVRHFEGRADLFPEGSTTVAFRPDYDTRAADLAAERRVLLEDGITADLGPEWNHFALWPERGGVGLTRAGLRKDLAGGYRNTGNARYARAFNDLLTHFFLQAPSPVRAGVLPREGTLPAVSPPGLGGGSVWNGLSVGARLGHGFYYYGAFVDSPHFTPDVRAAFIINLGEMAEVLERQQGGGNWDAQMSNGLMEIGLTYPEFRRAAAWVSQGFDRMVDNALENVYNDGVAREPTVGYHGMMMRRYRNVLQTAAQLDLAVPDRMRALTERMYEFIQHSTQPDGTLVPWGDSTPGIAPEDLIRDATFFHRPDFLHVGTGGRLGAPPMETSRGFGEGGFYYMRTGWDRRAHFAGIRCGPFGSHGHFDALSLVLASFGRPILIDPAITTYGTPEAVELTSSAAHSTLTVDNRNARSGSARAWVVSERFDYFAGRNDGYDGLRDIRHERRVWFLKPAPGFDGLWLVRDRAAGPGEREAALRYRFARGEIVRDGGRLWTTGDGGNLWLEVMEAEPPAVEDRIARIPEADGLSTTPVAVWTKRGPLPMDFTTVMIPFEDTGVSEVDAMRLEGTGGSYWVETGTSAFLFAEAGPGDGPRPVLAVIPGGRRLDADAAEVIVRFQREPDGWSAVWLGAVDATRVLLDGSPLHQSPAAESVDHLLR